MKQNKNLKKNLLPTRVVALGASYKLSSVVTRRMGGDDLLHGRCGSEGARLARKRWRHLSLVCHHPLIVTAMGEAELAVQPQPHTARSGGGRAVGARKLRVPTKVR